MCGGFAGGGREIARARWPACGGRTRAVAAQVEDPVGAEARGETRPGQERGSPLPSPCPGRGNLRLSSDKEQHPRVRREVSVGSARATRRRSAQSLRPS